MIVGQFDGPISEFELSQTQKPRNPLTPIAPCPRLPSTTMQLANVMEAANVPYAEWEALARRAMEVTRERASQEKVEDELLHESK
jgi:hypothetical protein